MIFFSLKDVENTLNKQNKKKNKQAKSVGLPMAKPMKRGLASTSRVFFRYKRADAIFFPSI